MQLAPAARLWPVPNVEGRNFCEAVTSVATDLTGPERESFYFDLLRSYSAGMQFRQAVGAVLALDRAKFSISGRLVALALHACVAGNLDATTDLEQLILSIPDLRRDADHWNCLLAPRLRDGLLDEFDVIRERMLAANCTGDDATQALVGSAHCSRGDLDSARALVDAELSKPAPSVLLLTCLARSLLIHLANLSRNEPVAEFLHLVASNSAKFGRIGDRALVAVMAMHLRLNDVPSALAVSGLKIFDSSPQGELGPFCDLLSRATTDDLAVATFVAEYLCQERCLAHAGLPFLKSMTQSPLLSQIAIAQLGFEGDMALLPELLAGCVTGDRPSAATFVVALKTFSLVCPPTALVARISELSGQLDSLASSSEEQSINRTGWKVLLDSLLSVSRADGVMEHATRETLAFTMVSLRIEPRWPSRILSAINWAIESTGDVSELLARLLLLARRPPATEDRFLDALTDKSFSREIAFTLKHVVPGRRLKFYLPQLLSSMAAQRISPTMYTFSVLMRAAVSSQDVATAGLIFHRMIDLRIEPDRVSTSDAYGAYLFGVVPLNFPHDFIVVDAYLLLLARSTDVAPLSAALSTMLTFSLVPNSRVLAKAFTRVFSVDQVGGWRLWDRLHTIGMPPSVDVYSSVLHLLAGLPQVAPLSEFLVSYNRMVSLISPALGGKPSAGLAPLHSAAARGAAIRGDVKLALKCAFAISKVERHVSHTRVVVGMLPRSMYGDRVERYSEIAASLAASKNYSRALDIVRKLHLSGYVPVSAVEHLLRTSIINRDPDLLAKVVHVMDELQVAPNIRIFKHLIFAASAFSNGSAEPLERTWAAMKKSPFRHSVSLLTASLRAFSRLQGPSGVVSFYQTEIKPLLLSTRSPVPAKSNILDAAWHAFSLLVRYRSVPAAMSIVSDGIAFALPSMWWITLAPLEDRLSLPRETATMSVSSLQTLQGMVFAMMWYFETGRHGEAERVFTLASALLSSAGYRVPAHIVDFVPLVVRADLETLLAPLVSLPAPTTHAPPHVQEVAGS